MKKTTKDEYFQAVYKVVHYIEMHYSEDLDLKVLAKLSGFSKYHFHRIVLFIGAFLVLKNYKYDETNIVIVDDIAKNYMCASGKCGK